MDREGEARILVARLKQKLRRSTTLRGALGPAAVIMHCDRVIAYCESINTWLMQGHQRCAWPSCSCRPCLLQKQRLSESAVKMRSSANTWQLSGDESSYEMVVAYESAAVAFFREAVIRLESLRDLSFALRDEIRPPPSQVLAQPSPIATTELIAQSSLFSYS